MGVTDRDIDDYGEEVFKLMMPPVKRNIPQYLNEQGLKLMLNPGANNALQAFLQAMLVIEPFKAFFLKQEYGKSKKLCENLTVLYREVFRPDLSDHKQTQRQIDLLFLHDFLKAGGLDLAQPLSVIQLLDTFGQALVMEFQPKGPDTGDLENQNSQLEGLFEQKEFSPFQLQTDVEILGSQSCDIDHFIETEETH